MLSQQAGSPPRPARRSPAASGKRARECSLAVPPGAAAVQELLQYEGAYLTEAFVQRVFEECQVHRRRSGPLLASCVPLRAHPGARGADLRRGDGLQVLSRFRAGDGAPLDPAGPGPRPAAALRDTAQRPIFLVEFPHYSSPGRIAPHELTARYAPLWPQALHYFWRVLDLRKRGSIGVRAPASRSARRGVRDGDLAQPARTRPRGFTGRYLVPKEGQLVLRRARLS